MYICAQRAPSGAARATSSTECVAAIDTTYTVPDSAAARAVANSPSTVKKRCIAVGATRMGVATRVPSTVVDRSTDDTSRSTCGSNVHRLHAATFSPSVTPMPLPRARYSHAAGSAVSRAATCQSYRSSSGASVTGGIMVAAATAGNRGTYGGTMRYAIVCFEPDQVRAVAIIDEALAQQLD